MNNLNLDQDPYKDVVLEKLFVTPEMAADMASRNYEHNRQIIKSNVVDIKKMMRNGTFVLSPDCLVFDKNNVLLNGNHRVTSIIETGLGQWFVVMRNVVMTLGQSQILEDQELCRIELTLKVLI